MSGPRNYFGGRNMANRNSFDRINPKYVPPSRHAIFIRGFNSDIDNHKIRDFFQEAAKSNCGIDFTSYNEELRKLSIALRFESHDIAKDIVTRFNNTEVFGCRLDITWFKDLKKARDRMIDERRVPFEDHRNTYKSNRFDYERKDNRDWSDNRRRFQPNNNNRSRSLEKGEANSDASYDNHKHSSDYERSRSKSSVRSDRSLSGSEEIERQSSAIKENKEKFSQINAGDKLLSYKADLDESFEIIKVNPKIERVASQNDNLPNDTIFKIDLDEKKKKKKKRKRRHMDHSGSQDSYNEPTKMIKYSESTDKMEPIQFQSTIAGDLNNWKQTASDSDDYLNKNSQFNKIKSRTSLTKSDKLTSEKNVKLLKLKIETIEKGYKKDSETYSSVINILIRKAPELKAKLESLMKEILIDAGNQCMDSMRDYVLHLSDDNNNNNNDNNNINNNGSGNVNNLEASMSPASSL